MRIWLMIHMTDAHRAPTHSDTQGCMKVWMLRQVPDLHGLGNGQRLQVGDVLIANQLPHKNAIAPHVSLHASSLMPHHLHVHIAALKPYGKGFR